MCICIVQKLMEINDKCRIIKICNCMTFFIKHADTVILNSSRTKKLDRIKLGNELPSGIDAEDVVLR